MNLDINTEVNSEYGFTKMPVLFLGHGSPMNAIEENEFVKGFREISATFHKPDGILCISAHWETDGTQVTAMEKPRTIHDFGGFPKELYDIQYPAPGNPALAASIKENIRKSSMELDYSWGLDHGAWSVIKHLYPEADIPVVQVSLDYRKKPEYHYELAKEFSSLRDKRVLIIGSGNMVHNLGMVSWNRLNDIYAYDWALEANEKMKNLIRKEDHESLINYTARGRAFQLSIPTPEHFIPLLYILALKEKGDTLQFFNDKPVGGSIFMTSLKIG